MLQTAQSKGAHGPWKEKLLITLSLKDRGTGRGDGLLQQVLSYRAQTAKSPGRSQCQQGPSVQQPAQGNPASCPPQRINKNYRVTRSLSSGLRRARAEEPPCPSSHGSAQHRTLLQPHRSPASFHLPGKTPPACYTCRCFKVGFMQP